MSAEILGMILCLCEAVRERAIREAVRNGACTVGAVAKATRAGTNCGSCVCTVAQVLKSELAGCQKNKDTELPLAAK